MPIGIGLAIGAIGAIGSSIIGGNAAQSAAQTQANASDQSAQLAYNEFQQNTANLQPYYNEGLNAQSVLGQLFGITTNASQGSSPITGSYNIPIAQQLAASGVTLPSPNDQSLLNNFTSSPGYQYQYGQMMNAVQNSAAGQTGAISGNMLQALQQNAQGLSSTDFWNYYNALVNNYNTQYNQALNQRNSVISVLGGLGAQGQSAAVQQGGFGQNAVSQISSALQTGASAQAAGTVGAANAASSALNSLTNNSMLAYLLNGSSGAAGYGGGSVAGYGYGDAGFGGGSDF